MNIFDRLFRSRPTQSKDVAKERLQLVLIHDRTDLPPALMEQLRDEILAVISKYVEFNRDEVELKLHHETNTNRLVADIPLRPTRTRQRQGA